jgi:hypothetical protein
MTLPRSVAEVLARHVEFELECIDRMYLNVYVPGLQSVAGAVWFCRTHLGQPYASTALLEPISRRFVTAIDHFAASRGIPRVDFAKGQRKDEVMARFLAGHDGSQKVLFIGRAQEKARVFRTEKRRSARGACYPWIVSTTAMVNNFYFYCFDADFGPFFIKFCWYFPYNAKLYLLTELQDGSSQLTWRVPALMATVPACVRVRRAASGSVRVGGASEWGAAGE